MQPGSQGGVIRPGYQCFPDNFIILVFHIISYIVGRLGRDEYCVTAIFVGVPGMKAGSNDLDVPIGKLDANTGIEIIQKARAFKHIIGVISGFKIAAQLGGIAFVEGQHVFVDNFPAGDNFAAKIGAQHQVAHVRLGRQGLWNAERRAAVFTNTQIRFDGSFREDRSAVGTIQCLGSYRHERIVYQNCGAGNERGRYDAPNSMIRLEWESPSVEYCQFPGYARLPRGNAALAKQPCGPAAARRTGDR